MSKRMVGKYFLQFDSEGEMGWQGRIILEPDKHLFLCQLYDWLMGQESDQVLVKLADMMLWKFYDTPEEWRYAGEQQMLRINRKLAEQERQAEKDPVQ